MASLALITGATGLIGRHLLRCWSVPGLEPVGVGRDPDLLVPGAAAALVRRVAPAVVVHLAWTASGTPGYRNDPRNDAWVHASVELANASDRHGAWLVGTGTAVDTVSAPADAYTAAKARLKLAMASRIGNGSCTWMRPYYVIDLEARRPVLVDEALRARDTGRAVRLRTPGSRHDFVHATDVAVAVQIAVRDRIPGEVPVGSGKVRPVSELMAALGVTWVADDSGAPEVAQRTPEQVHEPADTRILREHGWSPVYTEELFASA